MTARTCLWGLGISIVSVAGCAPARSADTGGTPSSVAPTPNGRWVGTFRGRGMPPLAMAIVIDSAAAGWRGSLEAASLGEDPVPFESVMHAGDSVIMHLSGPAKGAILRGQLSGDGQRLEGLVERGGEARSFAMARAGTAAADSLLAPATRVEASRRLAAAMVDSSPSRRPHAHPDSAKLVTTDIPLFWQTVDAAPPDSLAAWLQREYLEGGSVGVRDFIPGRILSAEDLAIAVRDHRARYDSSRAATLRVSEAEPEIRAAFRRLEALYAEAVFPDVYFVIGRFNSGGTATKHGLLIGAEMYRDPARLPAIVAHELIHAQQHYASPTLLEAAFKEGSADFVGELISGAQINNAAHEYGVAHERELWAEFREHLDDRRFFPWMYGRPPDGRPADLGYFIGYRIAKAYYDRASDKRRAIHDILSGGGGDVKALLVRSGYDP